VSGTSEPELIGATTGSVEVAGDGVSSHVRLDGPARRRATHALSTRGGAADLGAGVGGDGEEGSGERVFLNLENVRGTSDATAFQVYVGLGPDDDPDAHPELLAGSIAPFGLRKASQADGEHAGQGLTFVLDITDVAHRLHLADSFDVDELPVRLVPVSPVRSGAEVTVGRISIYRHAAEPG
jgi:tyrosinase